MNNRIGKRYAALSHYKDGVVYLYGYGVRIPDSVPPLFGAGFSAPLSMSGIKSPRFRLDNGKIIWGCECYYASELFIKTRTKHMRVVIIDIDNSRDYRRKATGATQGGKDE